MIKDGVAEHSCPGSSALAALDRATGGNWGGPWNSKFKQYEVFSIEGELHEFEPKASANYFWSFWLDEKEAEIGSCEVQLQAGDRVLFFPSCFGEACPKPAPLPLGVEAPATANVGEPVAVSVRRFTSVGAASPAAGATVIGGGAGAIANEHGNATLTFSQAGETMLHVSAPESIRTETTVCVHNGNDGTCGTTVPPVVKIEPVVKPAPPIPADVAAVGGVRNGRVYGRRHAPRVLLGSVQVPAGGTLREVRISLQRTSGRRCFVFSGVREAFVRARCHATRFFSVGGAESFSYLLPAPLPAGHYVYDIEAIDDSGHATRLVNGVSHVIFRVG